MEQVTADLRRQRAQELRAIAHFIATPKKQSTLLWLARDYDERAEHEQSAGPAVLIHHLHMMRIAEQLRFPPSP